MAELLSDNQLLGMGNPLLDISATVKTDLLTKHNLKANDAILTEDEQIFQDLQSGDYKVDYIAGGATQNSIRVAQWVLGKPNVTSYMGCVGDDDSSKILEEKAKEAGVNVRYQKSDKPTGRCAVLITDQNRSLVTKLDAANHFTPAHLEEESNWSVVNSSKVVYSAGFFLTVSVDSMLKVAKHCAMNNKTYCLNLSAPFLCQFFKDQMASVLPFTDIVFGNETEAAAYAEANNLNTTDVAEIATKIAMLPKENGSRSRLVVITQGEGPVIAVEHGKVKTWAVTPLDKTEIVDTNGAGDAFVGGFLAQWLLSSSLDTAVLDTAVKCGIWAATHCIKRSGCTMPDVCDFKP